MFSWKCVPFCLCERAVKKTLSFVHKALKLLTLSFLFLLYIYMNQNQSRKAARKPNCTAIQVESASETPSLRKRLLTFHKLAQTSVRPRVCFSMIFFLFNFMHLITIFFRARIIQVSKERRNIALVCPDTHDQVYCSFIQCIFKHVKLALGS